jgi:5-methylcytosine-specific restriction enzyme subunit McrC
LFLEGASLSEDFGAFSFRTFLLDMNKLFETFVTQVLRDRVRGGFVVSAQVRLPLGHERKVFMKPDLILSRAGAAAAVADCKYKIIDSEEYKNHDVYQVLAYCTATGVRRGLLVYPRHVTEVSDEVRVRNSDVVIRQTTIDLGKGYLDLLSECDRFADDAFTWALAGEGPGDLSLTNQPAPRDAVLRL